MKKLLAIISLLSVLTACTAANPSYTWEEHNVSFDYTEGFNVIRVGEDVLFLTQNEDNAAASGGFELMISISQGSVKDTLNALNAYDNYTQTIIDLGGHTVYEVEYTTETTGEIVYTIYLIEDKEGGSISFVPSPGYEEFTRAVIESLEFL